MRPDLYFLGLTAVVPKPRMTRRDKWAKRPSVIAYRAYCDELRGFAQKSGLTREILKAGCHVIFCLPVPRCWSKRKREAALYTPHRQRPDVDNLWKGLLDALMPEATGGDAEVWDARISKVWAERPAVIVVPLPEEHQAWLPVIRELQGHAAETLGVKKPDGVALH